MAPATGFGAPLFDQTSRPDAGPPEEVDEPDDRPRHPYTWLHLIVLALVAFVLGFLITILLMRGDDAGATPVHPSTSASVPSAGAS